MRAAGRDMPEGWAELVTALERRYPILHRQEPWLRLLSRRELYSPLRLFILEERIEWDTP